MKDLIQKVSLPKLGEDTSDFTEVDAEANAYLYELLI